MSNTNFYYLAAFIPQKNGSYFVYLPDIENGFTEGEDLADAFIMVEDMLKMQLQHMVSEQKQLPKLSSLVEIKEKTKKYLKELEEDMSEDIVYQYIAAPNLDMTPVRINMSIPKTILSEIDRKAHLDGCTRSGFMVKAATNYLAPPAN